MLSIIVPVDVNLNTYYKESLENFHNRKDVEIILVHQEEAFTRAERLNIGFHRSHGEMILFHHPRSLLTNDAIAFLIHKSEKKENSFFWGGFTHQFDRQHIFLRWISWYSNFIRVRWKGIVYLDHCIFFSRELWTSDLTIQYLFEDTELSQKFKKIQKPILLPHVSLTSAHRFLKHGIFSQMVMNLLLKIGYKLRLPSSLLFAIYQK
ncbi:hypothetical protein EHQ96_13210 [Leptospira levettii]|uniref:hypothetical protein n=1 Tax=Leptospira levettii TaxID=2023178 RepID=UPI0010833179|nr:hypothetical protein [Leptospira levettii]MCG6149953.1 hypothetical protein [Leptospira levettii]MCW7506706.1 hypothetical protein [Leptospira levettii]MCW7517796.1 hypothetical protein [Leptospira levettii]TGK93085.1 hypothetical protein EHQ34_16465 [Leptospira levettii]TGL21043.1 hypothetical protein EHQ42_05440 [Leptospira levettii]